MKDKLIIKLKNLLGDSKVLIDEPMKKHTTFKVGGPAEVLVIPENGYEISRVISIANEENIPYMIMGNGSNLLVRDGGIKGLVIKLAENMSNISINGNNVVAESGAMMNKVAYEIMNNSLKGFEFASGIPGTLGGAITMNAGAYGGEIKDVVKSVKCITREGKIVEYSNSEMHFGYRQSRVQEEQLIVLSVEMELEEGNYDEIKEIIDDLTKKRTTKQPLELASGGSTFKRPPGHFAGKLIEDSGLRGYRYRNVGISDKHCGFVVNYGDSTAEDVLNLINMVQKIVYDNFGVSLETEIRIIGEEK